MDYRRLLRKLGVSICSFKATSGYSARIATSNSFHQQNRVSYVSDNAVVELPFRWSLCYIALTPALQEPERKSIQLNLFQEPPVHKTFQKPWSCPTWQWQLDAATGHWLTVGYLWELGNMTRASLAVADFWQAACRNFSWTWSILDEASFKTL